MRSSSIRFAAATALCATAAAVTAHEAEARPKRVRDALMRKPLVLTSFVEDDRSDVRRNERLTFKFSAIVKKNTIDERSLRITEITPTGNRPAVGARIPRGNVIYFDPTRSQRNFDASRRPNSTVTEKDHPAGFNAFQDYAIDIPGPPELHVLKNGRGERILQRFTGAFRTNNSYDDPVPGQPYFVGDFGNGQLGFDPPRGGASGLVDEDAQIILEFSEPINIDTLDPSTTVIVERVSVNEQVPGFIKADPNEPSGRRFLFVPSLGFGSDEANKRGWSIRVTLTQGITDLAGNGLKRPVQFVPFDTRYVPGKSSSSIITETFNNQAKMDPISLAQGAEWNTIEKGALRGGVATTYPDQNVIYTQASTGITLVRFVTADPLVAKTSSAGCAAVPNGARTQMLYVPADVGVEAAITAVGWGASSNALFAANYTDITLKLGHTSVNSLGADFAGNVNIGNPLQVYSGDYAVNQAKNIKPTDPVDGSGVSRDPNATGFWLWPTFSAPFEWNGVNNLVFDASVPAGTNCQLVRVAFVPAGIPFPNRRAVSRNASSATADFVVETSVYDIQFKKRRRTTRATSLFYELASDNPVFAAPIVSPVGQPGGVQVLVEVEGAHGKPDPFNPGGFIADPTTATGWVTDVNQINGHRFFRFRVTMAANLASNQTARVTSIQVPYQF